MGISIVHIKNPFWRRTALILASIPVIILTLISEIIEVVWGVLRDFPAAFKASWKGY